MKIAVTYENGQVFQHFGHTESFKIYQTGGKDIESEEVVGTGGSGHGALAGFLKERDVNVLICGGIGGGAKNALAEAGITLVGGVSGSADQAVRDYRDGNLEVDSEATCDHHGEGEAHHGGNCGHEKCGS